MIVTQQDIDDFVEAYRRYCPEDSMSVPWNDPSWNSDDVLTWLANNPQVVVASGYQEFVAGIDSRLYQSLVESAQLDDLSRPLFRSFDGTWIVPSNVGIWEEEEWDGFRLEGLVSIANAERQIAEEMVAWRKTHKDEWLPTEFAERIMELDRQSVSDCSIAMPSFDDMVTAASRFIDNPMVDQTTWVSPKLWTPDRQSLTKLHLQTSAGSIISEIQTQTRDLADLHWRELEEIVAELLRSKGMEIHVVRENPQGGRDIIARAELVPGGEIITIAIEVKHRDVVGRPILEQAIHQNRHFPALMLVTSGRFTAGVVKEASKPENRMRVILKSGIAIRDFALAYRL
jgi:HJR/Mrr/RecB family endonuclease